MAADAPPGEERPAKLQRTSVDERLHGSLEDAEMSDASEECDLPELSEGCNLLEDPEEYEMFEEISAGEAVQVCSLLTCLLQAFTRKAAFDKCML